MTATKKTSSRDRGRFSSASQLVRARTLLGLSSVGWAGEAAVSSEDGRWMTLTQADSIDFNVALCYGIAGALLLASTASLILASGRPAVLMVAGRALANVQQLGQAGWVCVGSTPLMRHQLHRTDPDDGVRPLELSELPVARSYVQNRFELAADYSRVALPDSLASGDEKSTVWGLFDQGELTSCAVATMVEDVAGIWWMTTPSTHARKGYGGRLLAGIHHRVQQLGANEVILHASPVGLPFYESMDYEVLEFWQSWSRPRWALGRD